MRYHEYLQQFGVYMYLCTVEQQSPTSPDSCLRSSQGSVHHIPPLSAIVGYLRAAYGIEVNPLPALRRLIRRYNDEPGEWKYFHCEQCAREAVESQSEPAVLFVPRHEIPSPAVVWWPWRHQAKDPEPPYINMV